jgi:hypothetical protein
MMQGRILAVVAAAAALLFPSPALAHCDGIDGPVVAAARVALQSGDPNAVLIWVQPKDEAEIRRAFAEAISVRKFGPQARELADRYFFETLVRVHRAGEGAAYTGLKPAGRDLGPAIPLADKAVASGSADQLKAFVSKEIERGIAERFADLQSKRGFSSQDLAAGRAYVASYVTFIHYVEGLHEAVEATAEGHYAEGPQTEEQRAHAPKD